MASVRDGLGGLSRKVGKILKWIFDMFDTIEESADRMGTNEVTEEGVVYLVCNNTPSSSTNPQLPPTPSKGRTFTRVPSKSKKVYITKKPRVA